MKHEESRLFRAPATAIAIPVFHEINRSLVLMAPARSGDPPLGLIDLNEGPGCQDRVHGPVIFTDEAVPIPPVE